MATARNQLQFIFNMTLQDILSKEAGYCKDDLSLDNLRFKHSNVTEFLEDIKNLSKDKVYPFFFLNAPLVKYAEENVDDIIVTAGEIVFATTFLDKGVYSSSARDEKAFKPILTPLLDMFLYRMKYCQNAAIIKRGDIVYQYRYSSGNKSESNDVLDDAVCAIKLTDFQFRIFNK